MSSLRLRVHAGEINRIAPLIRAQVPADSSDPRLAGESEPLALRDEQTGRVVPAQYDRGSRTLSFIVEGELGAGEFRSFRRVRGVEAATIHQTAGFPAAVAGKLDRVVLRVADEEFATYVVQGTRRPYFWPVLGPSGASVVRGQGSAEHPHHTGLALNYGGHSEGGSVNIWSDWDEPPYGPGGRMLHRGFRRLSSGPVYGEVVQDLTYTDPDGEAIATEVRNVRWWWVSHGLRFLDFAFTVTDVRDAGPSPFLLMVRTPPYFGIPEHGRITNSSGAATASAPGQHAYYRASWIDASGPTGEPPPAPPTGPPEELPDLREVVAAAQAVGTGPWNGITVFDHPANDGYPNVVGKYAVPQQITQAHYPPAHAPTGPFTFRHRVLVHDGDADHARVAAHAADYASPCRVTIG